MPPEPIAHADTPPIDEAREQRDYQALGGLWLKRIKAQHKRDDKWRESAKRAEEAYKGERHSAFPIVFANVETVVPALISTPPVPDIRPRHYAVRAVDPVAMAAAQILERGLATAVDDGKLLLEMERCAQDAYMAGRATVEVGIEKRSGYECLTWREVPWNALTVGPARRWEDTPWIAIEDAVSADDIEDMRDAESKRVLDASGGPTDAPEDGEDSGTRAIYSVWDKRRQEVVTLTKSGEVIRVKPDPYQLPGFFPVARPVQPIELTTSNLPVCPQALYEEQASELALIQRRINGLISAVRAVGIVVGNEAADVISRLKDAPDGTLVPLQNLEGAVSATGDVSKAISWVPIQAIVAALQGLYQAREDTKALIYEISGISDVIRGESNPRETATAQGIKNQWGSLRIKRLQMALENHARDLFVIGAHIMAAAFSPEALAKVSASDMADPQFVAAVDFLSGGLDDTRIDVESGSTSRADLGQAKEEMQGFLTAAAGYFQTVFPLGQMIPEAAPSLILIFQQFSRYFKLGRQVEDAIDQFSQSIAKGVAQQAGQPKPPSPEEVKAQAAQAKAEADMQQLQAKAQVDQQKAATDAQAQQQKAALDSQTAQQDAALEAEKRQFEREKMAFEREKMAFELQMEAARAKTAEVAAKNAVQPKPQPAGGN